MHVVLVDGCNARIYGFVGCMPQLTILLPPSTPTSQLRTRYTKNTSFLSSLPSQLRARHITIKTSDRNKFVDIVRWKLSQQLTSSNVRINAIILYRCTTTSLEPSLPTSVVTGRTGQKIPRSTSRAQQTKHTGLCSRTSRSPHIYILTSSPNISQRHSDRQTALKTPIQIIQRYGAACMAGVDTQNGGSATGGHNEAQVEDGQGQCVGIGPGAALSEGTRVEMTGAARPSGGQRTSG